VPILYTILLGFSAFGLSKGFSETEKVMNHVRDESEESGFMWVLISLGIGWIAIMVLTVYARLKLDLSLLIAASIIALKLPALYMGLRFFEGRSYTKAIFYSDKIDQAANITLCSFALYRYGTELMKTV
jgi:hypothetical protein